MDKIKVCSELIKVANQLDKDGQIDLANELTEAAYNIANVKTAFFRPFWMQRGRSQNFVQMAYQMNNQALYQKAVALQQKEMALNQEKQALMQEFQAARQNRQQQPAQATQAPAQAAPVQQPATAQPAASVPPAAPMA